MTVAELRSGLDTSHERLFRPIRGLTEEQFRVVLDPGGWSIAVHLAHLLRVERAFLDQLAIARSGPEPYIGKSRDANGDDPALAQHLAVPQIVHGMLAARRAFVSLLDDASSSRVAVHHELFGRMTIEDVAAKLAEHEREHAGEIERLAAAAPSVADVTIPLTQRS